MQCLHGDTGQLKCSQDLCQNGDECTWQACELLKEISGWKGKEKRGGGVAFFSRTLIQWKADDWELLKCL